VLVDRIPRLVITKEHGSWAVLIIPMLVSACVVGKWTTDLLLVTLALLGVFLCYTPMQTILRHFSGPPQRDEKLHQAEFWTVTYFVVTFGLVVQLLSKGYVFLLWIGVAGVVSFFSSFLLTKRFSRTIATDLIAVAGLTLSGPSVYYVLKGTLDRMAFSLYVLNFLFFGCSVFYVHMKIRASATKKREIKWEERLSLGKTNLFYYAAVVMIVGILAAMHFTPIIVLTAFVPMVVHGLYGTIKLSSNVRFKYLGQ
jgi:hypothetical protein